MMTTGEGATTLMLATTKSSTTTKNPFTTTTTTTERSSTITTVESGSITTEPGMSVFKQSDLMKEVDQLLTITYNKRFNEKTLIIYY
ncbi:unnamed protein product [Adineta steineri]|uniref:Uncharacterized protein n=1 Tax=Adineta steineri TaxID=433720 RepID=A0A820GX56_9BILA|nr:unnamed protein product [Adineta steineri]